MTDDANDDRQQLVDRFVDDVLSEASQRGLNWREFTHAIQMLHLNAAFVRYLNKSDSVAQYLHQWGAESADAVLSGDIVFDGEITSPTIH